MKRTTGLAVALLCLGCTGTLPSEPSPDAAPPEAAAPERSPSRAPSPAGAMSAELPVPPGTAPPPASVTPMPVVAVFQWADGRCTLSVEGHEVLALPGSCTDVQAWTGEGELFFAIGGAGARVDTATRQAELLPALEPGRYDRLYREGGVLRAEIELPAERKEADYGYLWVWQGKEYPTQQEGEAEALLSAATLQNGAWKTEPPRVTSGDSPDLLPRRGGCIEIPPGIEPYRALIGDLCGSSLSPSFAHRGDDTESWLPALWSDGQTWRVIPGYESPPGYNIQFFSDQKDEWLLLERQDKNADLFNLRTGELSHLPGRSAFFWPGPRLEPRQGPGRPGKAKAGKGGKSKHR